MSSVTGNNQISIIRNANSTKELWNAGNSGKGAVHIVSPLVWASDDFGHMMAVQGMEVVIDSLATSLLENISNPLFDPLHDIVVVPKVSKLESSKIESSEIESSEIESSEIESSEIESSEIESSEIESSEIESTKLNN